MDIFKNLENFIEFLKDNLKDEYAELLQYESTIEAYLEDVVLKYCGTGGTDYELSEWYTKSHNPELYSYQIQFEGDLDEDFDTIFIF